MAENNKYSSELLSSTSQQLIKKMIPQLLLSVSLFSFLFSYSSYSPKFQLFSAKYYFQYLMSRTLNKNFLFLICNGLLVFLAKTSGLVRAPSESDDLLHKKIGLELLKKTLLDKYVSGEVINDDDPKQEEQEHEHEQEEQEHEHEQEEGENDESPKEVSIFVAESEEEDLAEEGGGACDLEDVEKDENGADEDSSRICWLFDDDDDEDDDEEGDEKVELSTEELNKKFEDFIRKMKVEIITDQEATTHKALMHANDQQLS
ncbi:hypothetical protein ABFX02_13G157800 [Erythranthe guttata]